VARTLVLNASNEPLSVVPVRRGVVLVLAGTADPVAHRGEIWRSGRISVDVPSVVRLRRYVSVPHARAIPLNRRAIFARDEHRCQYCGGSAENVDHVIPRVLGGTHRWDNVVAACRRCNTRKGGRTPTEAGLQLRRQPTKPGRFDWVHVAAGDVLDAAWRPFL
jgi:5-methylcytosine-specific restriction endonuclease McrA